MDGITVGQFDLVYNALSFGFATMAAATLFFWISLTQVSRNYKMALTITGLVTFIAAYHYFRIFESWEAAYTVTDGAVALSGARFNDAYRYVDWLLTVPLLLVELILVMRLTPQETLNKGLKLGSLAAIMVVLGYPGEISDASTTRWIWWALAMIPFAMIVLELFKSLSTSIESQPEEVRGLVNTARWVTVLSWSFYPVVFIFPMIGLTGGAAETAVQVGYTIADIVAKAGFGVLIYMIAVRKSEIEFRAAQMSHA
ncbi:MAG: bacteriorhodopsin-like [Candidatus Thiothrix sulfatifontis]|nr:MAG: bacteriorhodopsin-like [Candidatus Thiothrix sulfatifontis]